MKSPYYETMPVWQPVPESPSQELLRSLPHSVHTVNTWNVNTSLYLLAQFKSLIPWQKPVPVSTGIPTELSCLHKNVPPSGDMREREKPVRRFLCWSNLRCSLSPQRLWFTQESSLPPSLPPVGFSASMWASSSSWQVFLSAAACGLCQGAEVISSA